MAIATYSDLITAVTEWLSRSGDTTLIARIPDWITLAEAKFNRELRLIQMEKRATVSVNISSAEPEFISLPSDFHTMRRLRVSSVTGKPPLQFMTGSQADVYRSQSGNVNGQPVFFTMLDTEIELLPTPDMNYTLEMVYRRTIPALTASNTTNFLLTLAPDLYLYGTLLESAPYIQQDERIQTWALGVTTALDGLTRLSRDQAYNAGPLQMTSAGVTP